MKIVSTMPKENQKTVGAEQAARQTDHIVGGKVVKVVSLCNHGAQGII